MSHKNNIGGYISFVLAAAHREVNNAISQRLKSFGIQIEAWRVMEILDSTPDVTMTNLAASVLMNPPTLTKLVDRMVSNGLVHRQIAQHDHRQVHLLLTDIGKKRMAQVRDQIQTKEDEIEKHVGSDNMILLKELLQKISSHSAN